MTMEGASRPSTAAAHPIATDVSMTSRGRSGTTGTQGQRPSHVQQRALVFEDLRLLYVPVPKAACTAILWSLARLARIGDHRFRDSMAWEVSPALTIHDQSCWPDPFRFSERSPEARERIFQAPEWLRFTVVRHPFRRLWSAWQSKVLLAEPQFVEKFSREPWFPPAVGSGAEIVESFRAFLAALRGDPRLVEADVHWAPQAGLIEHERITYDLVGKVENLGETLDRIRDHVHETKGYELPQLPRTNVTPLPYADELFAESDVPFLVDAYADDLRLFGYDSPDSDSLGRDMPASWIAMVDGLAPALQEVRDRNERIADLNRLLRVRRQDVRLLKEQGKREEKLRQEEHRRNERLQKRLRRATAELDQIHKSLTWRLTAPFRKLERRIRLIRGDRKGTS